jgi:hypothetical protein
MVPKPEAQACQEWRQEERLAFSPYGFATQTAMLRLGVRVSTSFAGRNRFDGLTWPDRVPRQRLRGIALFWRGETRLLETIVFSFARRLR